MSAESGEQVNRKSALSAFVQLVLLLCNFEDFCGLALGVVFVDARFFDSLILHTLAPLAFVCSHNYIIHLNKCLDFTFARM